MADLDDGPAQAPLPLDLVKRTIAELVPQTGYTRILTHHPEGEYQRHLRHEECSLAVLSLFREGVLRAGALLHFAYDNDAPGRLTRPRADADLRRHLDPHVFARKRHIIEQTYGFRPDSWEARTVPEVEAFSLAETSAW